MKFIMHELRAYEISQSVVPSKNCLVYAIRPHLYVKGTPAGSLKLQLLDSNGELIKESESVSISSINSASYFHGYVRFYIDFYMKRDVSYIVKLSSTGYTYSDNAYAGWISDENLVKYELNYTPTKSIYNALDLEIWTKSV